MGKKEGIKSRRTRFRSLLHEALTGENAHAPMDFCTLSILFISPICVCVCPLVSLVCVCVSTCRDAVCTVQSAMLHYFLCVLLNLFMPELALPVIRVRNASLAHKAEPEIHSSLPVCCHLTPSTANLIQQRCDKRDRATTTGEI